MLSHSFVSVSTPAIVYENQLRDLRRRWAFFVENRNPRTEVFSLPVDRTQPTIVAGLIGTLACILRLAPLARSSLASLPWGHRSVHRFDLHDTRETVQVMFDEEASDVYCAG